MRKLWNHSKLCVTFLALYGSGVWFRAGQRVLAMFDTGFHALAAAATGAAEPLRRR